MKIHRNQNTILTCYSNTTLTAEDAEDAKEIVIKKRWGALRSQVR